MQVQELIPKKIVIGDQVSWNLTLNERFNVHGNIIRYLSPDYGLRSVFKSIFDDFFIVEGVPDGSGGWINTLQLNHDTPPGRYWVDILVFKDTYRFTVYPRLSTQVIAPIGSVQQPDQRSEIEKELDMVVKTIKEILRNGVSEYRIKGRQATYLDLEQLRLLRAELRMRLSRENGRSRNIGITF